MGAFYITSLLPANKGKWSYRFAIDGKSHEMGLGTYPEISLKKTRLTHAEQRKVFVSGRNPIETVSVCAYLLNSD